MKAVIIEDETAAVSSLKAILRHNSVVDIEVVAELESIEDSIEWFRSSSQPDIIFMDTSLSYIIIKSSKHFLKSIKTLLINRVEGSKSRALALNL